MAVGANTSESRTAYKLTWGNYNNGILINQNSNSGYNSQGWSGKSNVYAYANTNFTSAGVAAGAYYVQAGTWSQGAKVASYINGGYQALSTNNHDAFSSPPATAYVGSDNGYSGGANYLGIGLQRLAVYSSSLSSSDVSTVNNVIKDGP